jgi:predicted SAM-dependent methyltransferase
MKVIVGAGGTTQPGWLSLEESDLDITDKTQWASRFAPNSLHAILAEHVWEHLTISEGMQAARNCYTYLKRGGTLRIAVPDAAHLSDLYKQWCAPGIGYNGDDHKVFYNCQSLCWLLESAGFICRPREFFDENGRLFSDYALDENGRIQRTAQTYPYSLKGSVLGFLLRTDYTSLIVDGIKP